MFPTFLQHVSRVHSSPHYARFFTAAISHDVAHPLTIGIRREDPARLWERRCPLTPSAVEELVHKAGVRVLVQDCNRRVYGIQEFERAGATVHPTLSPAHIILGLKEVPLCDLADQSGSLPLSLPSRSDKKRLLQVPRTHLMFSHTGKGQPYNMPLLSKFINSEENSFSLRSDMMERLIDYEFLTSHPGQNGKRVVAFGWFAGAAGAVEGLCASGHDFLSFGVASPFLHLSRPYMCRTIMGMRESLRSVGNLISEHGTPAAAGPFVITITGNGNVAQGALAILRELPHTHVSSKELPALVSSGDTDLRKVYIVHAKPDSYLVPSEGSVGAYDRSTYYARPSEWKSIFHETIAPYTTLLINGAGWQPGFPRLMTNDQLVSALRTSHSLSRYGRFRTVADVSCDVKGGLEFVERSTTIDSPFFTARPLSLPPSLPGVQIVSIDILPAQIPQDASAHFSTALMPYLRSLIRQYQGTLKSEDKSMVEALERATIAQCGKLQGAHSWLTTSLKGLERKQEAKKQTTGVVSQKRVLVLGSGMIARPAIDELLRRKDVQLVVASNNIPKFPISDGTEGPSRMVTKQVDLADLTAVDRLVDEADIVVSLLPAPFHPIVAKLCIAHKKHMITASYISPAMRELHDRAVESNVLLLNEIGLDPGIDHCSAISLIQRLHSQNKTIKSFISFCGGLPTPEAAGVPLGYKFSWNPRGVLNASLNSAHFKLMGEEYIIQGEDLMGSCFRTVPLFNDFKFEGIANRDSFPYADIYGLGSVNTLDTILRGTLRYPGFCTLLHFFQRMGLLEMERPILLSSWSSLAPRALASKFAIPLDDDDAASFYSALTDNINIPEHIFPQLIHALAQLGISPIHDNSSISPINSIFSMVTPSSPLPPIELLTMVLSRQLCYQHNERDMVVLTHEVTVSSTSRPPSYSSLYGTSMQEETYTSTLIAYGTPTVSAMSRTVGLPVALATLAVLDGNVRARGVHGPTMKDIYEPVLRGLAERGLGMSESVRIGGGSSRLLRDEL